jgi:hypothetical protein
MRDGWTGDDEYERGAAADRADDELEHVDELRAVLDDDADDEHRIGVRHPQSAIVGDDDAVNGHHPHRHVEQYDDERRSGDRNDDVEQLDYGDDVDRDRHVDDRRHRTRGLLQSEPRRLLSATSPDSAPPRLPGRYFVGVGAVISVALYSIRVPV